MSAIELENLSGTRKAAILVTVLGVEGAGPLLQHLPQRAVSQIIAEVARLDVVEPETAQAVLESYFVEAMRPARHRGGRQVAQRLLASVELPQEAAPQLPPDESAASDSLLAPLLEANPNVLASVLAGEHAQTGALVLLNLKPAKAGLVLKSLPDEKRIELLRRMAEMRQVRGEVLGEVAESLKERLRDSGDGEDAEGAGSLERTAEVLRAMPRAAARALLDQLAADDPERAARLREMVNTFDSLMLANDRGIQELLRATETKTLAIALHGEEQAIVDKFFSNLSERARGMLEEEIELLESVREEDKQAAHQEIMEQALRLEQEDRLSFAEPADDGD
jgi:flagellar motor switch protein FliG